MRKLTRLEECQVGKLAGYLTMASKIASKSSEALEKIKFKDLLEALAPWSIEAGGVLGALGAPLKIIGLALEWVTKKLIRWWSLGSPARWPRKRPLRLYSMKARDRNVLSMK